MRLPEAQEHVPAVAEEAVGVGPVGVHALGRTELFVPAAPLHFSAAEVVIILEPVGFGVSLIGGSPWQRGT